MKCAKIFLTFTFIFLSLFLNASTALPTKEEFTITYFLKSIYSFENYSVPTMAQYNSVYPDDLFSSRIKQYMTNDAYDELVSKKLQSKYIKLAIDMGFDSECDIVKIKQIDNNNYIFHARIHIIFNDTSIKESYTIKGTISLTSDDKDPKISTCPNISIPNIGSSSLTSKLV